MSRKSQVKAAIDAKIKQNGKQEITGPVLNGVLTSMLDASLMDIKDAEGNTLPRDAEGNAILPQIASQSELNAEVTRAQLAEGILANSISGEVARAQAAEAIIAGLASSKLTRVDLACDGYEPLKITYRGETEALTFQEVYDLVTDKSKFVTLLDSEMFILLPSLSIDGDAIEFAGINVMSHQAEAQRVIINQENQVSVYPIELEDSDRKVSSAEDISEEDAFIKYPNVKALIDYVATHGGIPDASSDGKLYGRKDGAWAEVQGGESGKRGVISQTQTWYNDLGQIVASPYTVSYPRYLDHYVMSELQYGKIPNDVIHRYELLGVEFNDTDLPIVKTAPWGEQVQHLPGYFYLNGLGDISYDEMIEIEKYHISYYQLALSQDGKNRSLFWGKKARTNILPTFNKGITPATILQLGSVQAFALLAACEVLNFADSNTPLFLDGQFAFGTSPLKYVCPDLSVAGLTTNIYTCFGNAYTSRLERVHYKGINKDFYLGFEPRLSNDSILYAIKNATNGATNITITLHAEVYAKAVVDAEIQAALEANGHITLASR